MSYYMKPHDLTAHKTKNLGWVLRKSINTQIRSIEIRKENGTYNCEGMLRVFFSDGFIFVSEFASYDVLCRWVKARRSWYGLPLHYVTYGQSFFTTTLMKEG